MDNFDGNLQDSLPMKRSSLLMFSLILALFGLILLSSTKLAYADVPGMEFLQLTPSGPEILPTNEAHIIFMPMIVLTALRCLRI